MPSLAAVPAFSSSTKRTGSSGARELTLGVAAMLLISLGLSIACLTPAGRSALPTEAYLVAAYPGQGRLAILEARSFSAEFYTQGKITRIGTPAELAQWLAPGDGVLVPKRKREAAMAAVGDTLQFVAEDRKYLLFVKCCKE